MQHLPGNKPRTRPSEIGNCIRHILRRAPAAGEGLVFGVVFGFGGCAAAFSHGVDQTEGHPVDGYAIGRQIVGQARVMPTWPALAAGGTGFGISGRRFSRDLEPHFQVLGSPSGHRPFA
jgi:hypothetical protein